MGNIIVINPFEIPKGQEERALAMWDNFAKYFRRQPGFVSSKLHRAINPNARFHIVTVAEWASQDHFMAALKNPEFQRIKETSTDYYPNYPELYEIIRT
ncbi:MAG: antibiotic biosynthesis monooxygenase family protein [Prochloraceae cyanobacterium]|nr:antibiotic biosynthesis monooxygenase family protein [Prochloraceae cyanobacterium]